MLIIAAAAAMRLVGLTWEPFWVDEVCSYDFSAGDVRHIMEVNAQDIHPPGYYLGLAGWRGFVGSSNAALRGYSVVWSLAGVAAVFLLGRAIGGGPRAGLFAAGLLAVAPVDVYFAQEARMYAQTATLAALAAWFLWRWLEGIAASARQVKRGLWLGGFAVAITAALYSHYLAVVLAAAQGLAALAYLAFWKRWREVWWLGASGVAVSLAYLPWLLLVRLYRPSPWEPGHLDWMPAPRVSDYTSRLAHELVWGGGQLADGWGMLQAALSAFVFVGLVVALSLLFAGRAENAPRRASDALLFAAWLVIGPVLLAAVVGVFFHPVLFRPRFASFLVAPFVVLVGAVIAAIDRRLLRRASFGVVAAVMTAATAIQAAVPNKIGMRDFAAAWRAEGQPAMAAFVPAYNARVAAFTLAKPIVIATRDNVLRALEGGKPVEIWVCWDPRFLSSVGHLETELGKWLLTLGPNSRIGPLDGLEVVRVMAQPRPPEYPTLAKGVRLAVGDDAAAERFLREGWYGGEGTYRWTEGHTSRLVFGLDDGVARELSLELAPAGPRQRLTVQLNGRTIGDSVLETGATGLLRLAIPAGLARRQNELVLLHPDVIRPSDATGSRDQRELAVAVSWIQVN